MDPNATSGVQDDRERALWDNRSCVVRMLADPEDEESEPTA